MRTGTELSQFMRIFQPSLEFDLELRNQLIVSAIQYYKKFFEVYDTDSPVR